MKKVLFSAVSALAFASFADGVSSTEFGALQVPSTLKETIVGVPWLESGTGDADVAVSNLVLTAGLSNDDTLALYDASSKQYTDSWILLAGKWMPNGDTKSVTIKRGSALKLTRTGSDLSKGFYIMGKPTSATGTLKMTLASKAGEKAYSLVAFPFATDTSPNDSALTWSNIDGQTDALTLQLPDGSAQTYGYLMTGVDTGKWSKWDSSKHKWVDAPTIKAGMGAWFVTSSTDTSKEKSVSW